MNIFELLSMRALGLLIYSFFAFNFIKNFIFDGKWNYISLQLVGFNILRERY